MASAQLENRFSRLSRKDELTDPRTRTRTVPLEVMSLGFSRTGTAAMQEALEILGYGPVAHGDDVIVRLRDIEMFVEGLVAKHDPNSRAAGQFGVKEFDQLMGEYRAITDNPYAHFGPELMAAYPNAKVILVERDIEAWFASYSSTVALIPFRQSKIDRLINFMNPEIARRRTAGDGLFRAVYKANTRDELISNLRQVYREHYASIRAASKPGQLLEYKLGSGWEPLCMFLGKPVPDIPFPRKNERHSFQEKLQWVRRRGLYQVLKKMAWDVGCISTTLLAFYLVAMSSWFSILDRKTKLNFEVSR